MKFFGNSNKRSSSSQNRSFQTAFQDSEDTDEEDFKRLPNSSSSSNNNKLSRTLSSGSSSSSSSHASSCHSAMANLTSPISTIISHHQFHPQQQHHHHSHPNLPSFSTLWTLDDQQDAISNMHQVQPVNIAPKNSKSNDCHQFKHDPINVHNNNNNSNNQNETYFTNEQRPHTYTISLQWNKSKKKFCLENDISYFSQFTRRTCLLTFVQWHWIKTNIKQPCSKLYQDMLSSGGSSFFSKQPSQQKFQECEKQLRNLLLKAQCKLNCSNDFDDNQYHRQPLFVSRRDVALVLNECSTCRGHLFESIELQLKFPKEASLSELYPPKILIHMKEFSDDLIEN